MKHAINAEYRALPAGGLVEKLLSSQRRRLWEAFCAFRQENASDTVLEVGMTPLPLLEHMKDVTVTPWSESQESAGLTSHALTLLEMHAGERVQPTRHIQLPFHDSQFDWVVCNEVIAYAGSFERQYALVKELARVARQGVFLTVANRRHPIEFHTALPLLHWLPDAWWRRALKWSGKRLWADAANFNPVDSKTLYKLASLLPGKPAHDVGHKRVFGIKAHFFLMVWKEPT